MSIATLIFPGCEVSKDFIGMDEIEFVCREKNLNCWLDISRGFYVFDRAPQPPMSNPYAVRVCYPSDTEYLAAKRETEERRAADRDVLLIALGLEHLT